MCNMYVEEEAEQLEKNINILYMFVCTCLRSNETKKGWLMVEKSGNVVSSHIFISFHLIFNVESHRTCSVYINIYNY